MSKDNGLLSGYLLGEMMTGHIKRGAAFEGIGDRIRDIQESERAEKDQADIKLLTDCVHKVVEQRDNWNLYANRLRANLEARKMSEATLLKALKAENISHPLATEPGFEALFQTMLAEQYQPDIDTNGDAIKRVARMVEAEKISTEAARSVVDAPLDAPLPEKDAAEVKRMERIMEQAVKMARGEMGKR